MNVLINRQDAIDVIMGEYPEPHYPAWYAEVLKKLPSTKPERKTGKWILDEDPHDGDCRCSVCLMAIDQMHERNHSLLNALTGGKWWTFYNFCPMLASARRK